MAVKTETEDLGAARPPTPPRPRTPDPGASTADLFSPNSPKPETTADLFSPNSPKPALAELAELEPGPAGSGSASPGRSRSVRWEDEVYPERTLGESSSWNYGKRQGPSHVNGNGSGSGTATPTSIGPMLVPELPLAWDEALASFEPLDKCVYERKDLGLSREQDEMMVCDCVYDPDDPHGSACGAESDCINRAIFIECLAKECRAGKHCRNQRLSRKQYAPVDVVLTEKKGYGLRAKEKIPAGALIYEYLGEVVKEPTFRTRMAQYAQEGIKHFYFMMLQKEEYIDATKKGGIGRFANHSCNPNCEVQKWVVGRRMRMGIFTKRDVLKDEEITFNYNVDRYGHEAQICYCGEWNCVGTIGGKTQTDIGGMDDLFLDALGIMDEVTAHGMKGNRKKKARQLHEDDYVPTLHPILDNETTKVAAAIRQSMENPKMMTRLLERVKMTEDPVVLRQLMRMHGFSLMSMILTDMAGDRNIVLLVLQSLLNWKLQIRNKIEDSNIEDVVKVIADGPDEELADMAKQLLEYWSTLELSYKIPRVSKIASLDDDDEQNTTTIAEADALPRRHVQMDDLVNTTGIELHLAPVRHVPIPVPFFRARHLPPPPPPKPQPRIQPNDRSQLDAIIQMAQQVQVVAPPSGPATGSSSSSSSRRRDEPRKRQRTHRPLTAEEERRKEKRLTVLIGEVVVNSMSKYKEQMDHDTFKRYAKDCTGILVEKEKRGHSYAAHRNPSLSDEKKAKIKAFTKEFTHKVLRNLKAKGKLRKPGSSSSNGNGSRSATSRSPMSTPATTPGHFVSTPSTTPGLTFASTPTGSTGTPNGAALLDDIFGTDERDHHDIEVDDSMDVDMDEDTDTPSGATPSEPPSTAASVAGITPASPASASPARGAVMLDHASGPFLKGKSGPILVDRFSMPRKDSR